MRSDLVIFLVIVPLAIAAGLLLNINPVITIPAAILCWAAIIIACRLVARRWDLKSDYGDSGLRCSALNSAIELALVSGFLPDALRPALGGLEGAPAQSFEAREKAIVFERPADALRGARINPPAARWQSGVRQQYADHD